MLPGTGHRGLLEIDGESVRGELSLGRRWWLHILGRIIRAVMTHPYVELLRDRHVRILWTGLALSSLGGELYRVGALWLAAGLAGSNASLLVTAQSAAILFVSLAMGPLAEALPRRSLLIGIDIVAALVSLAVVAAALSTGLTFGVLVTAGVLLAAIGATGRPVLLSSLPALTSGERLQATNGLFDATSRVAQAGGPFLAAAAMAVAPAIHLLTANAASFLASAAAVAVGLRLDAPRRPAGRLPFFKRLARGVTAANRCPGVWSVLATTGVRGGAYALGFTVAVPLLFASGEGRGGLGAVAMVFGAAAAGELLASPVLVLMRPARPLMRQFQGYVVIGVSLALVGAAASLDAGLQVPAMAVCAFLMGVGGTVAGLQMMTFFGARLASDDYAAVLRLRLVLVIGAMMLATAVGPVILPLLGPAWTTIACGLIAAAAGLVGALGKPARRLGPGFEEPADPSSKAGWAGSKLLS